MRILVSALIIIICAYFIKVDLIEGTVSKADFYKNQPEPVCTKTDEIQTIKVTVALGDTWESLFALYPAEDMNFADRLELVYKFNPHLLKQSFKENEQVVLPYRIKANNNCTN
ncbi:hypothetical protein M2M59_06770 [Rummeliibacillus sp. G93]|mgnify:CR=1 FL=1|uniref:Uncharacterized protein n=1 Tax=Rummeliibacillus stabekisii TaxID=241244 RepID=A0A143HAP9_9BACL|nr:MULTISPECIES: hypothetical protein [Rummeliibacillus]AMW98803.1 hypothetical protein ATY39_04675 [Rummeliibacillus stabekisii]MBB5169531.1 hypothetical protein [Rummeliibacillus stabekisii]MCM3316204.1 hypothetical protein [Rummeliibacillus stabekisii]UQW98711.1 hypothetical protein M2M59_06770 [Rummeliibacillus sp. G93]GEL03790.1 hypothetical protein RST01_04170 [Rummeliibacillus stabekisii]